MSDYDTDNSMVTQYNRVTGFPEDPEIKATTSGSSATSTNALVSGRTYRFLATVDMYVQLGTAPTAASTTTLLPANTPEYWTIPNGVTYKFAGRNVSDATGRLEASPMVGRGIDEPS